MEYNTHAHDRMEYFVTYWLCMQRLETILEFGLTSRKVNSGWRPQFQAGIHEEGFGGVHG